MDAGLRTKERSRLTSFFAASDLIKPTRRSGGGELGDRESLQEKKKRGTGGRLVKEAS